MLQVRFIAYEDESTDSNDSQLQQYVGFELVEFDEEGLVISLKFEQPLYVSSAPIPDQVTISLRKDLFLSQSTESRMLHSSKET